MGEVLDRRKGEKPATGREDSFPISMLEGRLKCPACGSRKVVLLFDLPSTPLAKLA
jgi:hypothetical protein